jgi:Spy/CpxP family protein refolding chaperone
MLIKINAMKKLLVMACLAAGLTLSAQAQDNKTTKEGHKGDHKREWKKGGKDKLDLTADQQAKMKTLHESYKSQAKAIKDNQSLSDDQKKEQMKALSVKRREEMKLILTPEQQQKMSQQRRNMKKHEKREVKRK